MPLGYNGRILHVNLTTGKFLVEEPDELFYRRYIGGSCIGAYYLLKNMSPGIDPLDEKNIMVFAVSPVTGAAVSGTARHSVTSKSPLTNTIASSEAGGYWAPEFKFTGFDAVVITGKSSKPVYLWIHDGEYEIRDAQNVWGKITGDAQRIIRQELDDDSVRIAMIGPGGENLVKYACISNELGHFNGRNGMGAVMGSKNLKAIAVRGSRKPQFHDDKKIQQIALEGARRVKQDPGAAAFKELGTSQNFEWHTPIGGVPTRNWTSGTFEDVEKINAHALKNTVLKKSGSCWACAQSCKRVVEIKDYVDPAYGGPEYESAAMCGSNLGIGDMTKISKINELCSKYTLDTISLGGTIGFAMECYEKGIITSSDTGGLELNFGNAEAAIGLVELIAKREGIGDLLAEGTARVAERWGDKAKELAVHVKGKEFPAHMPQVKASLALSYACLPYGPDHVSSEHDPSIAAEPISYKLLGLGIDRPEDIAVLNYEKSRLFWVTQCDYSIIECLSLCQFIFGHWTIMDLNELVEFVNAVTGWNTNLYELMLIGQRRIQMFHAFNLREGITPKDDTLPEKLFKPLDNNGPSAGRKVDRQDFNKSKEMYYKLAGWDTETGKISEERLLELGLEWINNV